MKKTHELIATKLFCSYVTLPSPVKDIFSNTIPPPDSCRISTPTLSASLIANPLFLAVLAAMDRRRVGVLSRVRPRPPSPSSNRRGRRRRRQRTPHWGHIPDRGRRRLAGRTGVHARRRDGFGGRQQAQGPPAGIRAQAAQQRQPGEGAGAGNDKGGFVSRSVRGFV